DFALPTTLAKKANLAPANANTNEAYVDLGKIATVSGTIGDPKTKTDYTAIALLTAKAATAIPGSIGAEGGKILKGIEGVGGLLGGKGAKNTNATTPSNTST